MAILLADVGGTNARLALVRDGSIDPGSLERFRNEAFSGFEDVLSAYLASRGIVGLDALCVAVAGPVSAGKAHLTNRGWAFDRADLAARTGAAQTLLINDLTALGHAVGGLGADGLIPVWTPAAADRVANGQSIVLGLGTGVNVCAVRRLGDGVLCLEAEAGHAALPASVHALILAALGRNANAFPSVEELFAGRGIARLHGLLHGTEPLAGDRIVAGHLAGANPQVSSTLALFARALGTYCREIALQFMPREGMFLAGSVARGVIEAGLGDAFAQAFTGGGLFDGLIRGIPVSTIRDDMAGLTGCLNALRAPA